MKIEINECKISGFKIKSEIKEKEKRAEIEFINYIEKIRENNYKGFFLLLRNTIDKLKEKGIKKIEQKIIKEDWEYIKERTSWKIKKEEGEIYIIESEIEEVLENIGRGMGIENILKI